jgi:hypothetical protein
MPITAHDLLTTRPQTMMPEGPLEWGKARVADVFISYTSSDRDWAFWIANELKALGHTPHVQEWEIKGGDDIYAWMEQRHDAADHVLCVVSDEYLKAPYSTLERNAAIWQAAAKRPGFVLFVAVKPCRLPSLIDHYRHCQLYGLVDDEALLPSQTHSRRRLVALTHCRERFGKHWSCRNIFRQRTRCSRTLARLSSVNGATSRPAIGASRRIAR